MNQIHTPATVHSATSLPSSYTRQAQAGFTLLEVLIVTVLLTFLAISTFSVIRLTMRDKEDVDRESEFLQESRAVLSVLERDIQSAYLEHYEDLGWEPKPKNSDPTQTTEIPTGSKPIPVTIFQGKANQVFMSARSHQRMAADSPENEFHFVTYQMDGDNIIRAESLRAVSLKDREIQDSFRSFTLLEKVKTFKLEYWDKRSEKWTDSWDTERPETQDLLPEAVKIELEYTPERPVDDKKKDQTVKIVTAVRITEAALRSSNSSPAQQATPPSADPAADPPAGGGNE
jgi:type II secretion system protein J